MHAGKRPPRAVPDSRGLILLFTLGVLAVHALPRLPPLTWLLFALPLALLPWRWRAHCGCVLLGVAFICWRAQALLDERWPAEAYNAEATIEGVVASLPELQVQGEGEATWRFVFEPSDAQWPSRIRTAWYRTDQRVHAGECWQLHLRLRPVHGSMDPGGFDYEGWLFRQAIGATATVRDAQRCADVAGHAVLRLRQHIADRIREAVPDAPAQGLLIALVLGDESGISDADWDSFRRTGTSHLVAISGLNIAIVAGCAFFLFRWGWALWPALCLRLPAQKAGMLGSAIVALGYSLLAGFEPPVVRALLMLWFVIAAAWRGRLGQPSRTLAFAWLLILLLDPFAVMSPGLWLSFGAVAAIFYLSIGRHGAQGWLHALVLLQLMLSVALAPLTLGFFHGLSWLAPLVNLVAVPWFSLLTPVLLAAVLLLLAWPAAGAVCVTFLARVLQVTQQVLGWCAAHAPWLAAAPAPAALALAAFGVALLFAPRGLPLRLPALLCFLPLAFAPPQAPRAGFELTALDVGQGLAVVVRTAHHALLFDAGPAFDEGLDAGESVVMPFLLTRGIPALDLLVLSHGDNDHVGGAPAVLRRVDVRAREGYGSDHPCRDGEHWEWDGVQFMVLHPDAREWGHNNESCVLRVQSTDFSALLTGDIEAPAEARLVRDHASILRADVLLAPHHGSSSSSSVEFVDAVHPRVVIHSAGWHSPFGHPRADVVARYAGIGAQQFVTGASGAITVTRGEHGIDVEEWRRRAARFWNAPAP